MSDKKLLKFTLEDGTPFFFEVESASDPGTGLAGRTSRKLVEEAKDSLDDMLKVVEPVTKKLADRMRTGLTKDASEVEVKFGLKLTADAGVVFASAGGEVNFEITLKWKNG